MRTIHLTMVLAALLAGATLMGRAQTENKMEIDQKKARVSFNGKTYFEWSNDLRDKDVSIQEQAVANIKFYGADARIDVPQIIKLMGHKDVSMRVNATITLGFVGVDQKDAEEAVAKLKTLLYDGQQIVKFQAAKTLARFAMNKENRINCFSTTQSLINMLHPDQNSWEVRAAAATALGWVAWTEKGFDQPAFYAVVKAAIFDPCAEVRVNCVLSLILFGKPGKLADQKYEEKQLQTLIGEKQNKKVAIWAHVCLMRIANDVSDNQLRALSSFLKSKEVQVRATAARALAVIGPAASSQVDKLIDLLTLDEDPVVLLWVITALENMGDRAKEAIPMLEKLKQHKDPSIKELVPVAQDKISQKIRLPDDNKSDKKKSK
jgi:HEAT repeat protein